LAGEREGGTLAFLDVLTASRGRLWAGKLLVGLGLALSQGLVLAALFAWAAPPAASGRTGPLPGLLPLLTLDALAWGLLSSAFCRTVLAGAGAGAALYALSWVAMAGHVSAGGGRPSYLPGRLLADALALAGSYALFVGPRRRGGAGEGRGDLETEGPGEAG